MLIHMSLCASDSCRAFSAWENLPSLGTACTGLMMVPGGSVHTALRTVPGGLRLVWPLDGADTQTSSKLLTLSKHVFSQPLHCAKNAIRIIATKESDWEKKRKMLAIRINCEK